MSNCICVKGLNGPKFTLVVVIAVAIVFFVQDHQGQNQDFSKGRVGHTVSNKGYSLDLSCRPPRRVLYDVTFYKYTLIQNTYETSGLFNNAVLRLKMKISSWRFRHLTMVSCLLRKGLGKEGHGHPQNPPPLATPHDAAAYKFSS